MMLSAAITFVDEDLFRFHSGKFFDLRVRAFERVAIVRIAMQRRDAYYPTTLRSRNHRHLATELVLLVLFPFRDAFNFRRLHAVELVLVLSLLPIDARRSLQVLRQLRVRLEAARRCFSLNVSHHPPQVSPQLPRLFPRPLQLLRVRVAALLL